MRTWLTAITMLLSVACTSSSTNESSNGGGGSGGKGGAPGGGSGGTAATSGEGGSGAAVGGAAGAPACPNATCDPGETPSSCYQDCGAWWAITTAFIPATLEWLTIRGDVTFTAGDSFDLFFEDSLAGSNGSTQSLAIDSESVVTAKDATQEGQLSRAGDLMVLTDNQPNEISQTILVRKVTAATQASVAGEYRMIGVFGSDKSSSLAAVDAKLTFDPNGGLTGGSGLLNGLSVVYQGGTLTVQPSGEAEWKLTTENAGASTPNVTFKGWATPDGQLLVMSRQLGSNFVPGTVLLVRRPSGGMTMDAINGEYHFSHLTADKTVHGTIKTDGAGTISGGVLMSSASSTQEGVTGGAYIVNASGFAALIQTKSPVYKQAGTAAWTVDPAPVLVTHSTTVSNDPIAPPDLGPSLMLWVLK